MKKLICLFLAALLALSASLAWAEEIFDEEKESAADLPAGMDGADLVPYDYDHITVGNPTPLNGQFFTDLWGNDTSDTDVRQLVTGYSLVLWDSDISIFRFDRSVVSGVLVSDDPDGNRTYLISLYSDLYFSDGQPITAWDYAFSVLLQSSPVIAALGGHPAAHDYLVGYEDYAAGNTAYLSGLRVYSDSMIGFTVKSEALPYFYELSRLAFCPYPISAIAPGCMVFDDGEGAYIGSADLSAQSAAFTAEALSQTILAPETGYMVHPDPGSGPYRIVSYDGQAAEFEINPYYKGNEDGKKPRIKRLTYTAADNADMIRALGEGEYALLNKVAFGTAIRDGLTLCVENPQYTRSTYPRIGLTYIYFNPGVLSLQEKNVRQAIAYCFDKPAFISAYVGSFGLPVDGLYGMGQWMTGAVNGTIPYPEELPENASAQEEAEYQERQETWDEMNLDGLTRYELDVEKAVSLLEEAGWVLNEQGAPFDPQTDKVRCKEIGGELCRLQLTMGYQPRADVEQAFAEHFVAYLAQAGIGLTLRPLEISGLIAAHSENGLEDTDLVYLGDNFNVSFDPALFFAADEAEEAEEDSLPAVYRTLYDLSLDMDRTEPKDILGYMEKWITLQEQLTDLLPLIPVYSNVYFDFYTRELDDYWIEENISWAKAIVPARMRSISTAGDTVGIEIELSYADGQGELDLASLLGRPEHAEKDDSAGALSKFPASVREQVPAEYRTIYEFVAARLNSEVDEDAETIEMRYAFQTCYPEGDTVYLIFGIPGSGSDVDWFVQEGTALGSGEVSVTLEKEQWQKLVDVTFALAVASR